jgi:hypothetical protein
MDATTAFYLGAFCGLIFGFGLACIRPNASEREVAQAYEVGHLNGSIAAKQEVSGELASIVAAARRVA